MSSNFYIYSGQPECIIFYFFLQTINQFEKILLKHPRNKFLFLLIIFFISSCGKKEEQHSVTSSGKDFSWKSEIKISDIPDSPVRGFINGRELKLDYINFEQWRGSGDNVLNFGDIKPKSNCGYIESDNSFHLLHKAGEIKSGELLKSSFEQTLDGFTAYFDTLSVKNADNKSSIQWNCALVITGIDEKTVRGKIAICFKDDKKSWIAGTFEAIRCFN